MLGSQSYNYTIPIAALPGRSGTDLNLTLYYNSRVWNVDSAGNTVTFNADRDYPSYGFRLDFGYIEYDSGNDRYIVTESDGTKRALPNTSSGYQSNDGSFISYNPGTKVLSYSNGAAVTYVVFPSQASTTQTLFRPIQVKDANGNTISIAYVSGHDQLIQSATDTLGRVIQFNYNANNQLSSLTQNVATSPVDPSGVHTYATFTWGSVALNYSFASPLAVSNTLASGTAINVVTSCTYANGTGYRFTYGDWGIVSRIDNLSSTGAIRSYVSYNYPLASAGALSDAPAYTQETISPDNTTTFVWNYSTTKSGTGVVTATTLTDPNGNQTLFNLNSNGMISSVQMQDSAANTLKTVGYTWTTVGVASSQMPSAITTTLNDTGQQSSLQFTYDSNGNATDVYEYDFGTQLKRHTVTSFATGAYITQHLLSLPIQVLIKDASGNIVARSDLAYDSTSLSSVTGAASHDDTNFGSGFTTRGNLTSVTRYANASAGTGAVTRTYNYDTLGNLVVAQLDCCNQESFTFSSGTQYAYTDSVIRGPGSGPQFTTHYTWNTDKGLMVSSTDENGQVTTYQYDSMNRRIQTAPPSPGAQLNVAFGDSAASPTVTTSNGGNSMIELQTTDGLGRLIEVDDKNGTTVVSTKTFVYDGVGERTKASNAFAPGDTPVYSNFEYDALGRVTRVTPPSAGLVQYQYSGNAVTITDPAGKQRRNVTDAMGRLVEVDEPGETFAGSASGGTLNIGGILRSQAGVGAAPGTGTVSLAGTNHCTPDFSVCDSGLIAVSVNGSGGGSVPYPNGDPVGFLAQYLTNSINQGPYVNASWNGNFYAPVITITAKITGSSTNYPLSTLVYSNDPTDFTPPSYTATPSGPNLTGGSNGVTVFDSGTVTVTIGSFTASAAYSQSGNSTAALVATALAGTGSTGLNRAGSPVHATANGASISITYNTVGAAGNLSVTAASSPSNGSLFPGGSFSGSSSLTGGADAYTSGLAHPYVTTYSYDLLDDVISVSQAAGSVNGQPVSGQARSYSYDSLGRLLTSTTPEAGTVTNYYTDASNNACSGDPSALCRIQDARSVVKTLSYDAINRLSSIQYSDGTAMVSYIYDTGGSAAFALDRLTKIIEGANSETYTYDSLGRITGVSHLIDSVNYAVGYAYNSVNQLASTTYPTGRVVTQGYDAIGRLASISDGSTTYLSGLSFNAMGEALSFTYGNGVQGALTYNDHSQLSSIRYFKSGSASDILNLSYDYGTSNNGQIQAIHYYITPGVEDPTKSEYFTYDQTSRLSTARTGTVSSTTPGTWSLNWVYDRLGNRLQQNVVGGNTTGTSIGQSQYIVDGATNRIANSGFTYDAAGNLTADSINTYAYDAAGRVKQLNSGATAYSYFGPLRIKKTTGTTNTTYLYSWNKPIVEYLNGSVSKEYIYAGSQVLAEFASGAVTYHHRDHLSNRADTDANGNVVRTYGAAPFGESWYDSLSPAAKWKFTTYERDSESGLDYAIARYYSSGQGRFISPDPLGGRLTTPQALNRYAYVLNDPVDLIDPLGLKNCNTWIDSSGTLHCDVWASGLDDGGGGGGGGMHQPLEDGGSGGGGGGGGGGNPKKPPKPKPNPCPEDKQRFFNWLKDAINKMAGDLKTTNALMYTMAAKEGGWTKGDLDHNQPLNNPFGVNTINNRGQAAGNVKYPDLQSAVNYWEGQFGDRVSGTATPDDFVNGLQNPTDGGKPYNTADPHYESKFQQVYKSVLKFMKLCGVK